MTNRDQGFSFWNWSTFKCALPPRVPTICRCPRWKHRQTETDCVPGGTHLPYQNGLKPMCCSCVSAWNEEDTKQRSRWSQWALFHGDVFKAGENTKRRRHRSAEVQGRERLPFLRWVSSSPVPDHTRVWEHTQRSPRPGWNINKATYPSSV